MDLKALHAELVTDPLSRGYAAMTDTQAAASLNAVDRSVARTSITGSDLLSAAVYSEVAALTAAARDAFLAFVQMVAIDATNANVRTTLGTMFGAGTTTRANLIALASSTIAVSEQRNWAWAR